jgi:hypothetical protein
VPIIQHGVRVPDRNYHPNLGLAQLIVDAWSNPGLKGTLLQRDAQGRPTPAAVQEATRRVNAVGGFNLQPAVVISEAEYRRGYTLQQNERVYVLPNMPRGISPPALLNTAHGLMRTTPNGI